MRVVHRDDGVVFARQRHDVRQLGDVALHREDAVGEDQLEPGSLRRLQLVFEVSHVRMLVHGGLTLRDGLGEADGVDDRRVIQLVGDDDVLLAQQGGAKALIRVPAAHITE